MLDGFGRPLQHSAGSSVPPVIFKLSLRVVWVELYIKQTFIPDIFS